MLLVRCVFRFRFITAAAVIVAARPRDRVRSLRDTDRLDDLEDGRTAHDEDEQRQQPRSDGVLLLGGLGRLGHVAALGDVAAGLLVGHADSLLGSHCCVVFVG